MLSKHEHLIQGLAAVPLRIGLDRHLVFIALAQMLGSERPRRERQERGEEYVMRCQMSREDVQDDV